MKLGAKGEFRHFLDRWREGDGEALAQLVSLVHAELHSLASSLLRRERQRGHDLETCVLVNEAYLRLVDLKQVRSRNRAQFFCLATRILRHVLVDHARSHMAAKRGADVQMVALDEALSVSMGRPTEVVALDEALKSLSVDNPQQARILELSHFGGFNYEEIGEMMGISVSSVSRGWRIARSWLYQHLTTRETL